MQEKQIRLFSVNCPMGLSKQQVSGTVQHILPAFFPPFTPVLVSEEEASPAIKGKVLDQKVKERVSRHIEELKESMDWSFYPLNLPFPYQRIDQ